MVAINFAGSIRGGITEEILKTVFTDEGIAFEVKKDVTGRRWR